MAIQLLTVRLTGSGLAFRLGVRFPFPCLAGPAEKGAFPGKSLTTHTSPNTAFELLPSYQTIIAPGINQGIDAVNPSGYTGIDWSTNSMMYQKTESADDLRYRDDLQIMTTNICYGQAGGLALVPGTYHVFGNNGTTLYQGSVSDGNSALTNIPAGAPIDTATLYHDLTNASDHLLVVADYTVPIPAPALPALKLVNFGYWSNAGFHFAVSNIDGTPITLAEQARIGILTATNLAEPINNWRTITNLTALTNGLLQVSDTNRASSPQRFYRAVGR